MQGESVQENKMGVMPVNRLVLNMSLPMMGSMLVQALYNIVDSVFVSRINEQSLTAVSLAFSAQTLMVGLATGTAVGVNALLSRALGERDRAKASRVAENGVFLALLGYLVFLALGLFGSRAFFEAQTGVAYIVEQGTAYLTICTTLSFGLFGGIMFERLLQSTGQSVYSMAAQGVGAVLNLILDPICIFTLGWGVAGAAAATVFGQMVDLALGIWLNRTRNPAIRVSMRRFRPDWGLIGRICEIGFPSVVMMAVGSVMTFLMNRILILYTAGRETAATVFGVYFKLNSFVFMPVFGLNNGVVPILAYNYGARRPDRMRGTVRCALGFAAALMLLGFALFELLPGRLLGIFDASPQMTAIGVPALRIIAVTFPAAAVSIVLGAVFQALGRSVYSLLVSALRQLAALLPAAYLLARLGQRVGNSDLVWWSYPIAEVIALTASILFYRRLRRTLIDRL